MLKPFCHSELNFKRFIFAQWPEFWFGCQKVRSKTLSWNAVLCLVHEQWYLADITVCDVMNIVSRLVLVKGLMPEQERMIKEAKIMLFIHQLG